MVSESGGFRRRVFAGGFFMGAFYGSLSDGEESEEREGIGMEIIESYLDSMLGKLPDTPELRKARNELLQMMEDKFGELIEEGKSENEAAGTVIAEFGNLEELAESLGLRELLGKREIPKNPGRVLSLDEAERCLSDFTLRAVLAGIGLMLIIISPMAFFFS
ncbi:MAG: permease prefix domain 1-containing protein, partial [Oribacterium sp.]